MLNLFFRPFHSVFISEDGTYPGLCTQIDMNGMVYIRWSKWGYESPDWIITPTDPATAVKLQVTVAQMGRKFGLPPGWKSTPLTAQDIRVALIRCRDQYVEHTPLQLELYSDGSWRVARVGANSPSLWPTIEGDDIENDFILHVNHWLADGPGRIS